MPKSRYNILFLACTINVFCFTILRAVLYARSWGVMDHSLSNALRVFGLGFLYDVTFSLYFSIFFAIFLLVLPNKAYNSRVFKGLCHLSFFVFLYALYFTQVAEWLFWDEFSTRFNFIAVDYLVYGTEVTHNIYESYPVALSLWQGSLPPP